MPDPSARRWDLETLRSHLARPLADTLEHHDQLKIEYLCKPKAVADDATKLLVLNQHNQRAAVVLVSSKAGPELIGHSIDRARIIKEHLDPSLGVVILDPIAMGTIDSCTYTILPYCKQISKGRILKRVHRAMFRPTLLEWLSQVIDSSARRPDVDATHSGFVNPLEHLAATKIMSTSIRNAASKAIDRVQSGEWTPRHVVMHGDLWEGNVLFSNKDSHDPKNPFSKLVIIDWPGGIIDGYPMYDLIRLGLSMKLSHRTLHTQIHRHCKSLECDTQDARSYLLAALGHLGMNLGHFPPDRYAKMATNCIQKLDDALKN